MKEIEAVAEVVRSISHDALSESYNAGFLEGLRIAAVAANAEILRSARMLRREELAMVVSSVIKARRKMVETPRSPRATRASRALSSVSAPAQAPTNPSPK